MKKLLSLFLAMLMLFSVVACSDSNAGGEDANSNANSNADNAGNTDNGAADDGEEALPMEGMHLKMAGYAGFWPFRYKETDGTVKGIDIDFYNEFAKRLGFTWEFVDVPFAEMIAGVSTGLYDMAASMSYSPDREEEVDFSYHPYYIPRIGALQQKGAGIVDIESMTGKNVCVALGSTTMIDWVEENVDYGNFELLEGAATYTSVISGYNDCYISDSVELSKVAEENDLECIVLPEDETIEICEPYSFVFQNNYEYRDLFDQTLVEMYEDGTLDAIVASWIGEGYEMQAEQFVPQF